MNFTEEQLRVNLQIALLGEIYSNIRAVAFSNDTDKNLFLLRYYLDRAPNDSDYESVSIVMAEMASHFDGSISIDFVEECIYSDDPKPNLDPLDGFVYSRKE